MYTSTRGGNPFNRWDYMNWNNPWASPYNAYYYSPYYYNTFGVPWNRWGGTATRYHSENIILLSFNKLDSLDEHPVNERRLYQYQQECDNAIEKVWQGERIEKAK